MKRYFLFALFLAGTSWASLILLAPPKLNSGCVGPLCGLVVAGLQEDFDAAYATGSGAAPACSSTTWIDVSGNARNATTNGYSGCVSDTTGFQGAGTTSNPFTFIAQSGACTSSSGHIITSPTFNATNAVTAQMWVKTLLTCTIEYAFNFGNSLNFFIDENLFNGHSMGFFATGGMSGLTETNANTSLSLNTWHNIAVTYSSVSGATFYIDGTITPVVGGQNILGAIPSYSTIGVLARNDMAWTIPGGVSQILMYDTVLTSADIKTNCQAGVSRFSGAVCN